MHSTSFNSSHDQSMESATSSLQRSGLATTVGDTKSIVLALQALQEKIRKLENDRNFHQEQCEKAQKSHEAYKLEIEAQLDAERSQYRARESELQDLLARANAERSRLQATLEESKSDIGHFRVELEKLLDTERNQARLREDQLQAELQQLRSDLSEERKQVEAVSASLERLKSERDIVVATNRRLESTVRELISVNNNLMDTVKKDVSSGPKHGASAAGRRPTSARGPRVHADPSANVSVSSATQQARHGTNQFSRERAGGSARMSYMNPTHTSTLRDVRSGDQVVRSATPARPPSPVPRAASRPRHSAANTSAHGFIQPEQVRAVDEVYEELQAELRDLEAKYKQAIKDAARTDTSPEVLNATLNTLMAQIQRKSEQIRLMKQTKGELAAVAGAGDHERNSAGKVVGTAKGVEKALQRGQIVSELRALFAKPAF